MYDGASHKRFEHCLGVSHIACSVAERIWMMQGANKVRLPSWRAPQSQLCGGCDWAPTKVCASLCG